MDKEDCAQLLLSTLQRPTWKQSSSVSDWDLKQILWKAGTLLSQEQLNALLADIKRRGLIDSRDRRNENRIVAMWGVKITPAGEEWLQQRTRARPVAAGAQAVPSPARSGSDSWTPDSAENGPGDLKLESDSSPVGS